MAKEIKKQIAILRITEYKGFYIIIQQVIPLHIFQYIMFKDGNFYQGWNQIAPSKGINKKLDQEDIVKAGLLTLDMAFATAEAIIAKDNPEKINKENALGADVVTALESAKKQRTVQKTPN